MKLISLILFAFCVAQSVLAIEGIVVDSKSHKSLSLVSIKIDNENNPISGLSDLDGNFNIKVKEDAEKLIFSHIGYKTQTIKLRKNNKDLIVEMKLELCILSEVNVVADKKSAARKLIEKVTENLNETMITTPYQGKGFQRSLKQRDNVYIYFAEASIETYNEGYQSVGHAYNISKSSQYRVSNQELSNSYAFKNPVLGREQGVRYSYNNIFIPLALNRTFYFEIVDTIKINDIDHAVVNYQLNHDNVKDKEIKNSKYNLIPELYLFGELIVNLESYTLYQVKSKGESSLLYGNKRIRNAEFIREYAFEMEKGKSFLSKVKTITAFDEKSLTSDTIRHFISSFDLNYYDFDTTSISDKQLSEKFECKIETKIYGNRRSRICVSQPASRKKISTYNPVFWKNVKNTHNWDIIKNDLESIYNVPLEEQFANNSNYLISKKRLFELMDIVGIKKKKQMLNDFKYYEKKHLLAD